MARARICAFLGFMMLSAVSAKAGEVAFSLENRIGGDSNIFRSAAGEIPDGFYEFAPLVELRQRNKELTYDFRYSPIYQTFFDTKGIDGWDQIGSGRLNWNLTPRDVIGTTTRFSQTRRIRQFDTLSFDIVTPIIAESDRERIRRSSVALYYSHQFTPTLSARIDVDFSDIDFNSASNVDTRSYGGSVRGNYDWSEKWSFGLVASGRYRQILGLERQASSTAIIGNVAVSIAANLSETLKFSVQAGPTLIRTQQEDRTGRTVPEFSAAIDRFFGPVARSIDASGSCSFQGQDLSFRCPFLPFDTGNPALPDFGNFVTLAPPADQKGASSSTVSYFAEVRLTKAWRLGDVSLVYARSESAGAGSGTSSIVDSVTSRFTYTPSLGWFVSLDAVWTQRRAVSDAVQSVVTVVRGDPLFPSVPSGPFFARANGLSTIKIAGGGAADTTQWRASAYAKRQLTRQISVLGRLTYLASDLKTEFGRFGTRSVYGFVGVRYDFDPIVF